MKSKHIYFILGLVFGLFCLFKATQGVSWGDFSSQLGKVNRAQLVFVLLGFVSTHLFRTFRWKKMMSDRCCLSLREMFAIHSVGFLAIFILPLRLGEFLRPWALKKKENISMSYSLGIIFFERILDGLVSVSLLFLGIWGVMTFSPNSISMNPIVYRVLFISSILFFGLFVMCVVWVGFSSRILKTLKCWAKRSKFKAMPKVVEKIEHFSESLDWVHFKSRKLWESVFFSLCVWGAAAFSYYWAAKSLNIQIDAWATLFILGFVTLGLMIPGPPGFVGNFHYFIQTSVVIFGVSKPIGLAYATVIYFINAIYIMSSGIWGSYSLSLSIFNFQKGIENKALDNSE